MAEFRTLKLSILADVDNLKKQLGQGEKEVQSFGSKVADFGKKAALAFAAAAAAAGAYAIKLGVEGVKAAIEDEKAQESLRRTLENVTGATEAQVKATEDYISTTAVAVGIADDELRPSLDRLVRATGDLTKAQQLQSIALDISAGTGKSLQAVTEALSKAQEGNLGGLTRLGVGLTAAEVKTLSFEQITAKLGQTFEGQAAAAANTFQGRLDRLNVVLDEAKESIGFALLPILERLLSFVNDRIVPVIQKFADGFGGDGGLAGNIDHVVKTVRTVLEPVFNGLISLFNRVKNAIIANQDNFRAFADLIQKYVAPVLGTVLGGALRGLGVIAQGVINIIGKVVGIITKTVETAIAGINALIKAYNKIPLLPNIPTISTGSTSIPTPSSPSIRAVERGVPTASSVAATPVAPVTNNITVNGAIDSESTARQIAKVLTESAARGTGGGGGFIGGLLVT
jgi:phage-related protein